MEGGVWLRAASWRAVFGLEVRLGCVLEGGVWLRAVSWGAVFGLAASWRVSQHHVSLSKVACQLVQAGRRLRAATLILLIHFQL